MTKEEFSEELDTIIDAATGFSEEELADYVAELAEYDEDLAEAVGRAFRAVDAAADLALSLKEDEA